jgi:hypothetical protein
MKISKQLYKEFKGPFFSELYDEVENQNQTGVRKTWIPGQHPRMAQDAGRRARGEGILRKICPCRTTGCNLKRLRPEL